MIFEYGPITKPELSKRSNLSLPTINKIVDGLEQDGIVRQDGTAGSGSGKKQSYIQQMKMPEILLYCIIWKKI